MRVVSVGKKIVKNFIWNIQGGYHPKRFWDNWAEDFIKDSWQVSIHPQHSWMLEKVKDLKPTTILDVGCGFGRTIKFLIDNGIDPKRITGFDISENMISLAKKYIRRKGVKLYVSDILNLPFSERQFDLVIVHGVFMHVKPDNINKAISEVIRVSKKRVLAIEQNYGGNDYTFVHNYKQILKNTSVSILEYRKNKKLGLDYIYLDTTENMKRKDQSR